MKTIIVATDFEEIANNATVYAMEAAREIGAKVVLFHLFRISVHAANVSRSPSFIQDSIDRDKAIVEKKANELKAIYEVDVDAEWAAGEFQSELKRVIEERQADLLVMGMARKSVEQDLLGNTTTGAISRLQIPILAVPETVKFQGIKQILYACDVERGVPDEVLSRVREIALSFGAEVEIFHVSDKLDAIGAKERDANSAAVEKFGDGLDGIVYTYKNVTSNAVLQEIQNEVKDSKADLLVMVPHEYGFWGSLVHRSKTRAMASGSSIPLLSIPV